MLLNDFSDLEENLVKNGEGSALSLNVYGDSLELVYNSDLFSDIYISHMGENIRSLVCNVLDSPIQKSKDLDILSEDEKDLNKVNFDIDLFEAYTRGFLEGAAGTLTQAELDYLPWGAKLMTLECGIRFLTDYLVGDVYFHITRPEQNLDRCRTQFKLVRDMENQFDAMCEIVARCSAQNNH